MIQRLIKKIKIQFKSLHFYFFKSNYELEDFSLEYNKDLNRYYLKYESYYYLRFSEDFVLEAFTTELEEDCLFLTELSSYFQFVENNKQNVRSIEQVFALKIKMILIDFHSKMDVLFEQCANKIHEIFKNCYS